MKQKLNVYLAALMYAINTDDGIDSMLKILDKEDSFFTESDCWCWLENGRTEKEIIDMLRKMGYDIPKEIVGSDTVFDGPQYLD